MDFNYLTWGEQAFPNKMANFICWHRIQTPNTNIQFSKSHSRYLCIHACRYRQISKPPDIRQPSGF